LAESLSSAEQKTYVLRLGHRQFRDKRVTTHLFLAARAFGADKVTYAGQRDEKLEETIRKVVRKWGGTFEVEYERDWKKVVRNWRARKAEVIHLTMYGLPIQNIITKIRESRMDRLIVVGGPKVPCELFELADWNVAVTSQPHSEISALSIFLHELFEGRELYKSFVNRKIEIMPQAKGKTVLQKKTGD